MSAIVDFRRSRVSWAYDENVTKEQVSEVVVSVLSDPEKQIGWWSSLKNWAQANRKRSIAIVCFIIFFPIIIGLIDFALTHRTTSTSHVSTSNDNSSSTVISSSPPSSDSIPTSSNPTRFTLVNTDGGKHTTAKAASLSVTSSTSSLAPAAPTVAAVSFNLSPSQCFPLGSATLPTSDVPSMPRNTWWCDSSLMYGFMGWSYPLEASDCSDPTNSFSQINADFAAMKARGGMIVRVYAPECRQVSVWENLVKAAIANNMGLIPMVWWGFLDDQNLWETGQANIYSLFTTSEYAAIAPYVVHTAAFGSEPIGDQVDGGSWQFVSDLAKFQSKMNSFGIPVAVSEDWDRNGDGYDMNSTTGNGVGAVGQSIKSNTDWVHAHVMPYYHPMETPLVTDALSYTQHYLHWLNTYVKQPVFISETMWSSQVSSSHGRGSREDQVNLPDYLTYWNMFTRNCKMFKTLKVGWFMHTWSDAFEPYFGLLDVNNDPKMPNFKPSRC